MKNSQDVLKACVEWHEENQTVPSPVTVKFGREKISVAIAQEVLDIAETMNAEDWRIITTMHVTLVSSRNRYATVESHIYETIMNPTDDNNPMFAAKMMLDRFLSSFVRDRDDRIALRRKIYTAWGIGHLLD